MHNDKRKKEYENCYIFFLLIFFVLCVEVTLAAVLFLENYGNYGIYVAGSMSGGLWGIWWYFVLIQNPYFDIEMLISSFSIPSNRKWVIIALLLMGGGVILLYLINHPDILLKFSNFFGG
ncbi:MAG: hypothetical protein DRN07_03015 [Thermoplasmata archaeon]|nr:MAG: hypothetical protein DRN07_03015 [Thermoplasmata archaeon]